MSLKQIFSQDRAIETIQRAYNADKLPHAYIFAGPDGIGKQLTALQLAKLLLCLSPTESDNFHDSCGQCKSCKLIEADSHPDYQLVYKELLQYTEEGKNKKEPVQLSIHVVRDFLIAKAGETPQLSKRKVFVIAECERMNKESQNAILKTLEEPPHYCNIILLCTRLEKLLPTIKSRCQTIRFSPVDTIHITDALKQQNLDHRSAEYFARFSDGSIGTATQYAQLQSDELDLYKIKTEIIADIANYRYAHSLELAQKFLKTSKQIAKKWTEIADTTSKKDVSRKSLKTVISIIGSAFRDVMKMPYTDPKYLINADQFDQITRLASRYDPENAAKKVTQIANSLRWIDYNVNETLILEHLLLNLGVSDTMPAL